MGWLYMNTKQLLTEKKKKILSKMNHVLGENRIHLGVISFKNSILKLIDTMR